MATAFPVGTPAVGPSAAAVVLDEGAGPQVADVGELAEEFIAAVGECGGGRLHVARGRLVNVSADPKR